MVGSPGALNSTRGLDHSRACRPRQELAKATDRFTDIEELGSESRFRVGSEDCLRIRAEGSTTCHTGRSLWEGHAGASAAHSPGIGGAGDGRPRLSPARAPSGSAVHINRRAAHSGLNTRRTASSGRGITCALISSPLCDAAWAPASMAARTDPTSPRMKRVTSPSPI